MDYPKYRIHEIFDSIQTEGTHAGEYARFVRFLGCNLHCDFCDTDQLAVNVDIQDFDTLAVNVDIQDFDTLMCNTFYDLHEYHYSPRNNPKLKIRTTRENPLVVLTGGEPTMQNILPLVCALQENGCRVAIETNGTLKTQLLMLRGAGAWITLSPKKSVSKVYWQMLLKRQIPSEVKIIWGSLADDILQLFAAYSDSYPTFVQPMLGEKGQPLDQQMKEIMDFLRQYPKIKLSIQGHKFLGIR